MPLKNKIFLFFSFALLNFSVAMGNENAAGCNLVSTTNLNNIGYSVNPNGTNSVIPNKR